MGGNYKNFLKEQKTFKEKESEYFFASNRNTEYKKQSNNVFIIKGIEL